MIQAVYENGGGDAPLATAGSAGDGQAYSALLDELFDRCFDMALRIVGNRDVAAQVVHEVFLGAWHEHASLQEEGAFRTRVLRTSRRRALERMATEGRTPAADGPSGRGGDPVSAASAALGAGDATILDLHLRHGLTTQQLAEDVGGPPDAAGQRLFGLRGRLGDVVRSFVLWHQGRAWCPELEEALQGAGLGAFGAEAAAIAQRHAQSCTRCGDRQRVALAPEAMFAAVPLRVAGPELRARVIRSLQDAGVPVRAASPGSTLLVEDTALVRPTGRRVRRGGVVVAALVGALVLLVGGIALARRGDRTVPEVGAPVSSSLGSDLAATTVPGPQGTSPPAPGRNTPSTGSTDTALGTVATTPPRPGATPTTAPAPNGAAAASGPPVIRQFTALVVGRARSCATGGEQVVLEWTTSGATSVSLSGAGLPTTPQAPNGSNGACLPPTAARDYVLTATGPGGTSTQTVSV